MTTDRTLLLFAAFERDLYTFLRHAAPATLAQTVRALRLTAEEIDGLEALRAEAGRLPRVEFDAGRASSFLEEPEHDPFRRLRRARQHRSAEAQARVGAALTTLVTGKRVALVGPSISIVGCGAGASIEAFDIVVRMNFQWPVPAALVADLGSRIDVLYHCCNGDFPVADLFLPEFARTRFVCWQANAESFWLEAHGLENGIPSLDVSSVYAELEGLLGTPPFTGTVAIEHLRRLPVAELHLAGISFGCEPHYAGYRGHGASARTTVHAVEPQLRYFRDVIARDPRVRFDAALERLRAG